MNLNDVMQALEGYGTEQTRKTYRRHGVTGAQFGVLTSALKTLQKQIKRDHALALALWETGNYDARVLATMIIDPKQITEAQADEWVLELDNYGITDYFSGMIAKTPFALKKAEVWTQSDEEWIGYAGWGLLAQIVNNDTTLPDSLFESYLEQIEREIHTAKNYVRYGMNNVLIGLGVRSEALGERARAAARRIGKVEVDHGETNCKTPDALEYMDRILARRETQRVK